MAGLWATGIGKGGEEKERRKEREEVHWSHDQPDITMEICLVTVRSSHTFPTKIVPMATVAPKHLCRC